MNKMRVVLFGRLVLIAGIMLAGGSSYAEDRQEVLGFKIQNPKIYTINGDRFIRSGTLSALPPLPAPVLAEDSRGYVQIQTNEGPVWVDRVQVLLKLSAGAKCPTGSVTVSTDRMNAGVRGAGEGCK